MNRFISISSSLTEKLDEQRVALHNVVPIIKVLQDLIDSLNEEDKAFLAEHDHVIYAWKSIYEAQWRVKVVPYHQRKEVTEIINEDVPNNEVIRLVSKTQKGN